MSCEGNGGCAWFSGIIQATNTLAANSNILDMDIQAILPLVCPLSGLLAPQLVPGVYAIGMPENMPYTDELAFEPVYIGQTNNLNRRFEEHFPHIERNQELKVFLWTYLPWLDFRYEVQSIPLDRDLLERELIAQYCPRFNNLPQKIERCQVISRA